MAKLKENFWKAQRIFHTSGNAMRSEAIEGCCYGRDDRPDKHTHTKYCGERFWEFISGSESMYIDIIVPLGTDARVKNEEYNREYDRMITKFTREFSEKYCDDEGNIRWEDIVKLNSSANSE